MLLVVVVLVLGVFGADVDIVWTGEEFLAHACFGLVDDAVGTLFGLAAAGGLGWDGGVGLFVPVGAGDDDLEDAAIAAEVIGGGGLDAGAPERAFEVCDGGRVGAVSRGVEGWVTLDVEVEACAERGVVT